MKTLKENLKNLEGGKMEITKEEFKAYEEVRQSGKVSMFDAVNVIALTGLSREKCLEIMKHYLKLQEKFSN